MPKFQTSQLAIQALKKERGNVEDNLYRFRNFGRPTDVTGNGETYADVIKELEVKKASLDAAIADLEAS